MNKKSGFVTKRIEGNEVSFKFGTNSFALFCEVNDISMNDAEQRLNGENMKLGDIRDLIWSGAASYCRLNNKEEGFNRYTVGEWLDSMGEKDLDDILQAFKHSKILGKSLDSSTEEEEKKSSNP